MMATLTSKAISAWAGFLSAILLGLCLASCSTDSEGGGREIDWNLGDSLKTYSNVVITILDPLDSTKVLDTVFAGKLADPASLESYRIPDSIGGRFTILIQGYNAQGLLALESRIAVKDGKPSAPVKTPADKLPGNQVTDASALLSSLDVSDGTLVPTFKSDVEAYVVEVPFDIDSLTVNASAVDSGATLALAGKALISGSPSAPIALLVGENRVVLAVKGRGGAPSKNYTLTVKRSAGNLARLASITVSSGELSPHFSPDSLSYSVTASAESETVAVAAVAADPLARIEVGGEKLDPVTGKILVLAPGASSTLQIAVLSQDSSATVTYVVKVTRAQSAEARLESLLITGNVLSPDFHPDSASYKATVAQAQVAFLPVSMGKGARITVSGKIVASGALTDLIPATASPSVILIEVTAADGKTTKSYSVSLVREVAANALGLLALATPSGSPVPFDTAFRSDWLLYGALAKRGDSALHLTVSYKVPTLNQAPMLATVDGSPMVMLEDKLAAGIATVKYNVPLRVGLNTIRLEMPEFPTYFIRVVRQPSQEAGLSLLTLSAGTLKPVFNTSTVSYTDTVPNATASLTVNAKPKDSLAMVIVRLKRWSPLIILQKPGALADTLPKIILPYKTITVDTLKPGKPSVLLALLVGHNLVETEVVAEDGITRKIYSVSVERRASPKSTLAGLSVGPTTGSPLTLNPVFSSTTLTYSASTIGSFVVVKPIAGEPGQTITVNGKAVVSGSQSQSITLVNGVNAIKVAVIAPDGVSTSLYTLNVAKTPIIFPQK